MPKVLFIGDIVGKPGRSFVMKCLPAFREERGIDLVVANAENAAAGAGITTAIVNELLAVGVDGITLGDHVWDQRGFADEINGLEKVCRPANLPPQCPGRTHLILEKDGFRLAVCTLLGNNFMKVSADCPFRVGDRMLGDIGSSADAVLMEIHAETTSEKVAFGWYFDGRASAVIGTHTHIPTADNTILPRGTAYQTDAGMSGPYRSVLGREVEPIVLKFLDGMPRRWPVAEGDVRLCGLLVEIDRETGMCVSQERICLTEEL
ncbi:YmdB family metallophosphoesterase [Ruficoccus amylovorans]|uniref:YmdB family metallophosphoesterase n=1 Tax=Ruficoccus amylovorans TaxID=1804625 RepID=A0A842HCT9_9BACT|nr:TIGR00282 family metallophosphoesterase [Ruficoccus amylovorans]MBC2593417.1 YmdB family metallophosphoesterase [Ruficoccus amylovorans]